MQKAYISVSTSPGRATPADSAEMVNQLLYGEHVLVLETQQQWVKIRHIYDGYESWHDEKHLIHCDHFLDTHRYEGLTTLALDKSKRSIHLLRGSLIPLNKELLTYPKETQKPFSTLQETALSYLGAPYLWGGRSPFGIDCSGFTQLVFAFHTIKLPRDAYQQEEIGENISWNKVLPGDLAYFTNAKGKVVHVGILLEDYKIIHAAGEIRIDALTEKGIFRSDWQKQTHQLHSIKRLV